MKNSTKRGTYYRSKKRIFYIGICYVLGYVIWSRIAIAYFAEDMPGSFYYLPAGSSNMLEYAMQIFFMPLNGLDHWFIGTPLPAGLLDYGLSG